MWKVLPKLSQKQKIHIMEKSNLSRHLLKLYSAKNQCIGKHLPDLLDNIIFQILEKVIKRIASLHMVMKAAGG